MPQKPAKFGIKFWLLCDVDPYYVLQAFPYTRKTDRIEEGLGDQVVMKLMNPYFGTVRQNRKEIPEEIKLDKKKNCTHPDFCFLHQRIS